MVFGAAVRGSMAALLWVLCLSWAGAGPAHACMVCIPIPETTAADHLIEGDIVVLAREDPDQPFSYREVEVLKGSYDGHPPIDMFVNSTMRRKLANAPDRSVVLVHNPDRSGWRSLGNANAEFEGVVRQILERAPSWQTQVKSQRIAYFASLLDHRNPILANLAYLEVGRAPYREIKALSGQISRERLRRMLTAAAYYEWRALAILMLAQSDRAQDRDEIRRSFGMAAKYHHETYLAAWATAYIEIDEADAIDVIEARYFEERERTDAELIEISKALSVHGSDGHVHLRDRMVEAYAELLDNHPSMVGPVAKDLAAWQAWSLAERVRTIAGNRDDLDRETLFVVGYYLGLASEKDRHAGAAIQ